MDFDLVLNTDSNNPIPVESRPATDSSSAPPPPVKAKPFHLTRRLSSNVPLFTSIESKLPFKDPETVAKFDALLDKFPKPPQPNPDQPNKQLKSVGSSLWGGSLLNRFNPFSKS
jgi:hypothetical protein